ncbi:hypothetical protein [Olsenella phocaeensis]|uniref:hypothetical protein n=1 Tax=Olsenella phocaeensis TaxID=1852385 RepID=UPI000930CAC4|nr:hypothetical protein [Olsenella phocaeensis]
MPGGKADGFGITRSGITYFKRKYFVQQLRRLGLYREEFDPVEFEELGEMSWALRGTGYTYVVQVVPREQANAVELGVGSLAYVAGPDSRARSAESSPSTLS